MRRPDIIPAGWALHHRPTAAATMTAATCQIRHQDVKVTDPATGRTTTVPGDVVIDSTNCRVERTFRPRLNPTTEQQLMSEQYLIAIPYTDAVIAPGYQAEILTTVDDRMAGRTFTIISEAVNSVGWERDLWATDNESD